MLLNMLLCYYYADITVCWGAKKISRTKPYPYSEIVPTPLDTLLVFEMKFLRAILRITRSDRLRNIMIRKKLNISETIEDIVLKRRHRWFGHVVRNTSTLNSSYKLDFNKKRPRGQKDGLMA